MNLQQLNTLADLVRPLCAETAKLLKPLRDVSDFDKIEIGTYADLEHFTIEAFSQVSFASPRQSWKGQSSDPRRWVQRIPGARIVAGKVVAPTTDFTVIILCALWPGERIQFKDAATQTVFNALAVVWQRYFAAAQLQADYKAKAHLSPVAESFRGVDNLPPAQYQQCAAHCAASVPGYAFFMEQGTGKTYAAILRIDHAAERHNELQRLEYSSGVNAGKRPHPYRFVVVCPKNVRFNWESELAKFSRLRGCVQIVTGGKLQRRNQLINCAIAPSKIDKGEFGYDWSCLLLSYGSLSQDIGMLSGVPWNLALLDESHFIKSHGAQRTKAAIRLRDAASSRMILTGTPIPNNVSELFPQLEFLGNGLSGFKSQKAFNQYYQNVQDIGNGEMRVVGLLNKPILQERLARMSFIIRKEEALEGLPPKTYDFVQVEMTAEQTLVYERALDAVLVEAEKELGGLSGDGHNYAMVLQNLLKKMLRLSQITSGFYVSDKICDDDGTELAASETHRFDPNNKLEKLVEILKAKTRTNKTIVWACWKQDIASISARLALEGIDHVKFTGETTDKQRAEAIDRFNNDFNCRVWLGNPAAGGVGLNLLGQANDFTNCDQVIYYSQGWSSSVRSQSEDRAHRRGTRCHVQITDLVVLGTIDQQIRERVVEKRVNAYAVQDIRELLGRLSQRGDYSSD